jgi:hypothetical protein
MPKNYLLKFTAFSLGLLLLMSVKVPSAWAGRYVFNQTPETINRYFGQPSNPITYTLNYPTTDLRRLLPGLSKEATFRITFVNNKVNYIELEPNPNMTNTVSFNYEPAKFFEYIFGYKPSIMKETNHPNYDQQGAYYHELCLGDGAATSYTTTVPGDLFIKLYYNKACEPPYK